MEGFRSKEYSEEEILDELLKTEVQHEDDEPDTEEPVSEEEPEREPVAEDAPEADEDWNAIQKAWSADPDKVREIINAGIDAISAKDNGDTKPPARETQAEPPEPASMISDRQAVFNKGMEGIRKMREWASEEPDDYPTRQDMGEALEAVESVAAGVLGLVEGHLSRLNETHERVERAKQEKSRQDTVSSFQNQWNALVKKGVISKTMKPKNLPQEVFDDFMKTGNLNNSYLRWAKAVGLTPVKAQDGDEPVDKFSEMESRNDRLKSLSPARGSSKTVGRKTAEDPNRRYFDPEQRKKIFSDEELIMADLQNIGDASD